MLKPAQAESGDPYDWSDYDGEVILDDPEFFMFTEEDEAEEQENAEEAAAPVEETQDEGEQESSEQPADPVQEEPTGEQPGVPTEEPGEHPAGEPEDQPTEEPGGTPAEQPTEEPAQTEEPPAPVDLKTMFKVEIKVPADWTNAKAKNIRVKITPLTGSAWDKVKYKLNGGDWVEIKEIFTLLDGYYHQCGCGFLLWRKRPFGKVWITFMILENMIFSTKLRCAARKRIGWWASTPAVCSP